MSEVESRSDSKLSERILRAIGADVFAQIINVGSRIILVPLFLSQWGGHLYGEWLVLTALSAWFALGDLGAQAYYVNKLTERWANQDISAFVKFFTTGLATYLFASGGLFFIVSIFLLNYDGMLFGVSSLTKTEIDLIVLMIAMRFLISLPLGLYLGVYRAINRQATGIMFGNAMDITQLLLTAVVLIIGIGQPLHVAVIECLIPLLFFPLVIFHLNKIMGDGVVLLGRRHFDPIIFRQAFSPSVHFLLITLSQAIMAQGIVLVLAGIVSPVKIALFSSLRTLSSIFLKSVNIVSHASWPELTRLSAIADIEGLTRLFRAVTRATFLISFGFIFIVSCLGHAIFRLWVGDNLVYDHGMLLSLAGGGVLSSFVSLLMYLLMATNRHVEFSRVLLVSNVVGLCIFHFSVIQFGMSVGFLSAVVSQSALCLLFLRRKYYLLGLANLFTICVRYLALTFALVLVIFITYRGFNVF